jgi:flavin reductase (DIM6/NTAB) family NADH-FMN oxidoreductase RutF
MAKIKCGPQTWLFPMPVLLVGSLVADKPNFMTVAWGGIACSSPPMLSVAIRPVRHTLIGIKEHRVFSVNIPNTGSRQATDYCGVYSGKQVDKSGIFKVFFGNDARIPLIDDCPVCLECKVLHLLELGSHVLVIGEITETHVNEDCISDGKPLIEKIDPLIYASGKKQYHSIGTMIGDAYKV